jgi:hypothetical protein
VQFTVRAIGEGKGDPVVQLKHSVGTAWEHGAVVLKICLVSGGKQGRGELLAWVRNIDLDKSECIFAPAVNKCPHVMFTLSSESLDTLSRVKLAHIMGARKLKADK